MHRILLFGKASVSLTKYSTCLIHTIFHPTGDVQIALTNAQGQDIPINIQDNGDGTFTVEYLTPSPGDHRVTVLYAGAEIPQSPIVVPVQSHVDVTKVKVDGLEPSEYFLLNLVFWDYGFSMFRFRCKSRICYLWNLLIHLIIFLFSFVRKFFCIFSECGKIFFSD